MVSLVESEALQQFLEIFLFINSWKIIFSNCGIISIALKYYSVQLVYNMVCVVHLCTIKKY